MLVGIDVSKFTTPQARELWAQICACETITRLLQLISDVQNALLALCDESGRIRAELELEGEELTILRSWALDCATRATTDPHHSALVAYQKRNTAANLLPDNTCMEPGGELN